MTDPAATGDETREQVDDQGETDPAASAATAGQRRPRRVRSLIIGVVIAAVLAVVLFVGFGTGSSSSGQVAAVGSTAPDFTIPALLGGAPVHLAGLGSDRGRPVVLNFFASWCIPCQQETPLLAKTAKTATAKGSKVQFVGVDVADPKANGVAFVHQAGITYPVGTDGNLNVAESLYGLTGQPNTFFIDSSGKVVGRVIGPVTASDLTSWLHRLNNQAA
ncbi:MAG: TlpA disulfide reductase family protein [Acidimicrobiales bacterium]